MSLIKTPQHWLHRTIDTLLTLFAWAVFLYLLARGLKAMAEASRGGPQMDFMAHMVNTFGTLTAYALCAVLIGLVLLGWAKYNEIRARRYERRERVPDIATRSLLASFRVTSETYQRLRAQQVLILHNDEVGDLVWVEDQVLEEEDEPSEA